LILTLDTSPETQVSSDWDAAGIPEPPRDRYPPVASFMLGAVATIPPLPAIFRDRKISPFYLLWP
jgi:hypothetical protein